MGDFAKIFYEKFFLRDFLGKLGPGAIVTLICIHSMSFSVEPALTGIPTYVLWLVGVPVVYALGLGLQILSEFVGLHWSSPAPRYIFFVPVKFKANSDFYKRFELMGGASKDEWTENNQNQWERFVVQKEVSGNIGAALLVLLSISAISFGELLTNSFDYLILMVAVFSCFLTHLLLANRQADYEIRGLKRGGLLDDAEANEMQARIWLQ